MTAFIVLAAALALAVAALIAIPLLKRREDNPQALWSVLAVLAVLLAGGGGLYHYFSNWDWQQAAQADSSPQSMVTSLARKLARQPDDLDGWLLLGRSYSALQESALAVRAYERANQLAQGRNADALTGLAKALIALDDSQLDAGRRGADLIEQALKLDPEGDPEALLYGAAIALQRNDLAEARIRFENLLKLDPPQNLRTLIQQQLEMLDAQLASGAQPPPQSTQPGKQAGVQAGKPAGTQNQPDATLQITVTLSPRLKLDGMGDAPLFVMVRDPSQPGPPLAVKRLTAHFPQVVELSSADTMIAGHGMAPGQQVEVVARISRSGSPNAQSGDLFGAAPLRLTPKGAISITIDQTTP